MKTVVIVQCRLSSTRLPNKALYMLDDLPLVAWTLRAMKQVKADDYFVACDFDSESKLKSVVKESDFKLFTGPKDDVLERFCKLIKQEDADIVVRATADNPFLFYEAAQELLDLYKKDYYGKADYITFTGLPHGSGIEIFNGKSLLKAKTLTNLVYDHEHVGPALYNHPENFNSVFLPSPAKYNFPQYRTTVDTYADYIRACDVIDFLVKKNVCPPYKTSDVICALEEPTVAKKILYIPSVKTGQGTGHFRRCLELAKKTNGCIYISEERDKDRIKYDSLLDGFDKKRIITKLPLKNEYDFVVCDMFELTKKQSKTFCQLGNTLFIDEGSKNLSDADYILDVIPSYDKFRNVNLLNPFFIPGPENKKDSFPANDAIKKVLICFGGEDPANLTGLTVQLCLKLGFYVTAIFSDASKTYRELFDGVPPFVLESNLRRETHIDNLKEHLAEYDLVITHYGFTAFECLYANTPVLLVATSPLHKKLSDSYGFKCLTKQNLNLKSLQKALADKNLLMPQGFDSRFASVSNVPNDLSRFVVNLTSASKYNCPICKSSGGKIAARTLHHTFRKCSDCGMIYISFSDDSESVKYEKAYFAEEYKKQYGRTYLEDFESIKKSCVSRVKNIADVAGCKINGQTVLDIGCAYGPFLSACKDAGLVPFGSDIAVDAVNYVCNELKIKAVNASFAELDLQKEFGVEKLDIVTMWYVIEHIRDLDSTLKSINTMLKEGGIFAFSTPNAAGLSRKINKQQFFEQSPKDHYSLWELPETQNYLKRFGFEVCKIAASGVHPERLPFIKKHNISQKSIIFKLAKFLIKAFKIGDTYEVYCKKIRNTDDGTINEQ